MLSKLKGIIKRERFAIGCAVAGLLRFLATERRALLYFISTTAVITAGCVLGASATEWALLTGAVVSVWVSEMFNTCVEEIMNLLHPGIHPKVKRIKDVAAGAVLLTCICSVTLAGIIFLPKIL